MRKPSANTRRPTAPRSTAARCTAMSEIEQRRISWRGAPGAPLPKCWPARGRIARLVEHALGGLVATCTNAFRAESDGQRDAASDRATTDVMPIQRRSCEAHRHGVRLVPERAIPDFQHAEQRENAGQDGGDRPASIAAARRPTTTMRYLPQKPLNGGTPASDSAWSRNSTPSHGVCFQRLPMRSRLSVRFRQQRHAADEEQRRFHHDVVDDVKDARRRTTAA